MPLPKKHMILTVKLFILKISFKILPILFIINIDIESRFTVLLYSQGWPWTQILPALAFLGLGFQRLQAGSRLLVQLEMIQFDIDSD